MTEYIDLTHTFTAAIPVYPGDPKPELKQIATIEKDGFTDYEIKIAMHVGTHMDGPWHMIADGRKLSEMPLEKFFGRGVLVDARGKNIDAKLLAELEVRAGDIVLVCTGWEQKFGTNEYFKKYPELTEAFANRLAELGVSAVGMDTPSPDHLPFKVHNILLSKEILIIENLNNLEQLIGKQFEVIALPAKFDTDAAQVRAVARIN